jgi:hypothetical protein
MSKMKKVETPKEETFDIKKVMVFDAKDKEVKAIFKDRYTGKVMDALRKSLSTMGENPLLKKYSVMLEKMQPLLSGEGAKIDSNLASSLSNIVTLGLRSDSEGLGAKFKKAKQKAYYEIFDFMITNKGVEASNQDWQEVEKCVDYFQSRII